MIYQATLKAKLIYIFTIPDEAHRGCIKIGETTLDEATNYDLSPNCKQLNVAAKNRIDKYTKTAGIRYDLKHTELTISIRGGNITSFNDKEVHRILLRSGIKRHDFSEEHQGKEWFECSVETAVKAIQAAKEGRKSIRANEIYPIREEIVFRPEQIEAIEKTVKKFSSGGKMMLWNAKMRFGKTICALQVVKNLKCKKTLILTHRPVVDEGWFEDFHKIFSKNDPFTYGSCNKGEPFESLEKIIKKNPIQNYIYFASMQDLRGAQLAGGKYDKNVGIFKADYDLIIIDEAHEGTQTELGQNVIKLLTKKNTRLLNLSGTPFNILDDYKADEIFTWDYVMEQKAKSEWEVCHFGDINPYADLPCLNIFTFELGKFLTDFSDVENDFFKFNEFFRTWTGDIERDMRPMPKGALGKFVHENSVRSFLDLIVKYDKDSNYPFSTEEFRDSFRHTLWMVPGVKEARALSALLKEHPVFGQFEIVNVAGAGDIEVENDDALRMVTRAIGKNPEETRTITLSCGKLTTGVTVRPWTAVMMLAGSYSTDAKAYMQTIFRVQSPYTTKDGRHKENCFVFDFAPDRTLKVLAETNKVQTKKTASNSDHTKLQEFLNFCPVIGYDGTKMAPYKADRLLEQLKRAYITRVTRNGCDDPKMYNEEMLRKLDAEALAKFQDLHKIIGSTKANHRSTDVDMAKNGLTDEEYEKVERIEKKKRAERTPEELKALEEAKEKRKNAEAAMSILRGISIRLPLLMYGAELIREEDITLENFASLIDEQSWAEFMPRGVSKEIFADFIPYYDPDVFRAVGRNYRDLVREADKLPPLERTKEIARIFSYFRNPDKETVLTPWRVVNMHIGDCIGGQVFFEEDMETEADSSRFVDHGEVTAKVFKDPNTRILEINSKTGLYPLYMTYSVFAERLEEYKKTHKAKAVTKDIQYQIWDDVLQNHIFVVCKTEMAKSITKRTLVGFRNAKVNARYFEDLINKITNQPTLFISKVSNGKSYWKNNKLEDHMKFNAIVGNPPYQSSIDNKRGLSSQLFPYFIKIAILINPSYLSLIAPSRWFTAEAQDGSFIKLRDFIHNHDNFIKIINYANSKDIFPGVEITGGINFFLFSSSYNGDVIFDHRTNNESFVSCRPLFENSTNIIIPDIRIISILNKILATMPFESVMNMTTGRDAFGISGKEDKVKKISSKTPFKGSVKLYCAHEEIRYISRNKVIRMTNLIDKWKIFTSKGNGGAGYLSDCKPAAIIGKNYIGEPGSVCTDSLLPFGSFDNEEEASSMSSYMKTKFFRFCVGILKSSQNLYQNVYKLVPQQNFSKIWTDKELYKKYNLSQIEIDFIEKQIKPMNKLTDSDDD